MERLVRPDIFLKDATEPTTLISLQQQIGTQQVPHLSSTIQPYMLNLVYTASMPAINIVSDYTYDGRL